MAKGLFLLSTDGCHLCEVAKSLLDQLHLQYELVDIIEEQQLVDLYGDKIPVLMAETAEQALFWPFEQEQIKQYIEFYGISSTE